MEEGWCCVRFIAAVVDWMIGSEGFIFAVLVYD